MPAKEVPARALRQHALRIIGSSLAAVLLASASGGTHSRVEATNWTRHIAAARSQQVAYEAAMRAADQQIRSLTHAVRRAQRQLTTSKRHVRGAMQQRAEARSRHTASVTRLRIARDGLAAASAGPLPLVELPDLAEQAAVPASLPFADLLHGGEDIAPPGRQVGPSAPVPDVRPSLAEALFIGAGLPPRSGSEPAAPAAPEAARSNVEVATQETVDILEQQAGAHARILRQAERRLRRAERGQRVRARSVASLKSSRRAAMGRREGAEAGLASAILSMSRLAQRRVAKKTSVRPGQNSSFTWPTRGRLTQGYGCTGFHLEPARGSCRHFHDGIDVAGYRGTLIRASAVGVVSYIGWNPWDQRQRAFMIVVAHPGGYETLYGHVLPTRHVRVGQLVRRGEVIGSMGSTGRSTGVHLHLELRRGRVTLNPLAFF